MRIYMDDTDAILKQLKSLYYELPVDLRTQKNLLPASEIIFEAVEYITSMKIDLDSSPSKRRENNNCSKSNEIKPPEAASKHLTTSNNYTIRPILINQNSIRSTAPHSLAQNNFRSPPPIATTGPRLQAPKLLGPPNVLAPISLSAQKSFVSLTSLAQHGNNGTIRLSGLTQRMPGGSKPITIHIPKSVITASNHETSSTSNRIISSQETSNRILSKPPPLKNNKPADLNTTTRGCFQTPDHGLICPKGCTCLNSMDKTAITEWFKGKLNSFLESSLKIQSRDAETWLTYNWIQEGVFEVIRNICPRKDFFKFCRVVTSDPKLGSPDEKESCIILEKTVWPEATKRGCVKVNNKLFSLPILLVKLFREGFGEFPVSSLILYSRSDCEISQGLVPRTSSLCLNPKHYIIENIKADRLVTSHECVLRIRADSNGVKVVCLLCHTVYVYKPPGSTAKPLVTNQKVSPPIPILSNNPVPAIPKNKPSVPIDPIEEEIEIKTEDEDLTEDPEENTIFDKMEDEFEGMLRSFEQSVAEEEKQAQLESVTSTSNHSETIDDKTLVEPKKEVEEEQETENVSNSVEMKTEGKLQITIQDKLGSPIEDLPAMKRRSVAATLGPIEPVVETKKRKASNFQCWKCLEFYETKEMLVNHSCLTKMSTADQVYVCRCCGFCSEAVDSLKLHNLICKQFNLPPLQILDKFDYPSDDGKDSSDFESQSSRSKRHKKSDSSKCEECGITFATNTELVIHMEKIKCKSIQCDVCHLFFANTRTHQSHNCPAAATKKKPDDFILVKVDPNKLSQQPVKCQNCSKMFQSYDVLKHHQSSLVECGLCTMIFPNTCALFNHECGSIVVAPSKAQPSIKDPEEVSSRQEAVPPPKVTQETQSTTRSMLKPRPTIIRVKSNNLLLEEENLPLSRRKK